MFGYDIETTIAAGVALIALMALIPLLLQKNAFGVAGALGVGAIAWTAGSLTVPVFTGFAADVIGAVFALLIAVVGSALAALGVGIPPQIVVLVLLAIPLLTRGGGKKKK